MWVSLTLLAFAGVDTRTMASLLRIAVLSWHPKFSDFYGSVFLTKNVTFSVSNFSWLVNCFFYWIPPRNVSRISSILEVLPEVGLLPVPSVIKSQC
jgi:hypothetical protein